jgi:hypothetical protein
VLSFEAVAALRAKGYDARRLEDGFPEWKAAGIRHRFGISRRSTPTESTERSVACTNVSMILSHLVLTALAGTTGQRIFAS